MVGLHAYGSDTERNPKIEKMKDRLVILENIFEQMLSTLRDLQMYFGNNQK